MPWRLLPTIRCRYSAQIKSGFPKFKNDQATLEVPTRPASLVALLLLFYLLHDVANCDLPHDIANFVNVAGESAQCALDLKQPCPEPFQLLSVREVVPSGHAYLHTCRRKPTLNQTTSRVKPATKGLKRPPPRGDERRGPQGGGLYIASRKATRLPRSSIRTTFDWPRRKLRKVTSSRKADSRVDYAAPRISEHPAPASTSAHAATNN